MTFLKWAGGKSRLLKQLLPFVPHEFEAYHEPFLGSGAMFFALHTGSDARIYDINPRLVQAYEAVRDSVESVILLLEEHRSNHGKEYYHEQRDLFNSLEPSLVKQAARLIYLNKTGFNGLYRESSQGFFNTSFGNYAKPAICDPEKLRAASKALQGVWLERLDFRDSLSLASIWEGDFVYLDPPYVPLSSTSSFTGYTSQDFTFKDQEDLRELIGVLHEKGVQVMISNSDCEYTRNLYRDFHVHQIQAPRAINSKAAKRGPIPELVVTTYETKQEVMAA